MAIKQGHSFPKSHGFTASAGMVPVKAHFRGGVAKKSAEKVIERHTNEPAKASEHKPHRE